MIHTTTPDWLTDSSRLEQNRRSLVMLNRSASSGWSAQAAVEALEEIQRGREHITELERLMAID